MQEKNQPETDSVVIRATPTQIEQLVALGALTPEQAAAGRAAGGLEIRLSARQVAEFERQQAIAADLEELAQRIHNAGMSRPVRLFLMAGRPLSFMGSQMLLMAQPTLNLLLGKDPTGKYARLLDDRRNVDKLTARLEALETRPPQKERSQP
jgi:hypothetical protein